MTLPRVPVKKTRPDIGRFLKAMAGQILPDRPPLVEYLIDPAVMRPILEDLLGRTWVDPPDSVGPMGGRKDVTAGMTGFVDAWLDNQIAFWCGMGYDFIRAEVPLPLPAVSSVAEDTATGHYGLKRTWQGLHEGLIRTWDDFEEYPWPEVGDEDFYIHRYISAHLPDGMGFLTCHAGGVYEQASRLLGYETLCLMIYENPTLLRAVIDRLGGLIFKYHSRLFELDRVSAIFQGEDLGFRTQTLLSPGHLREYILPWHKKYAELAHSHGRPYFLHSCGNVSAVMEPLIEEVRIDGKHSFEDSILPITKAKELYGDRICLLGGVDVDKLARLPPPELRTYVRGIIERCAPGGRFAIGAGNSIPSYIPVENYLAMLDEALC